jgi:hypothetical protein
MRKIIVAALIGSFVLAFSLIWMDRYIYEKAGSRSAARARQSLHRAGLLLPTGRNMELVSQWHSRSVGHGIATSGRREN